MRYKKILYVVFFTIAFLLIGNASASAASKTVTSISQLKNEVYSNVKGYSNSFEVIYTGDMSQFNKEVKTILPKIMDMDDMVAGTLKSYQYRVENSEATESKISYKVDYFTSKTKDASADAKITKEVSKIKKSAKSDYDKVKEVNDFIVRNTRYGGNSMERYTAYGLMNNKYAVCQGYALVAYKMLEKLGLPVRYVVGTSMNQDHAWNKVKVDGKWYNLDTTWNDPTPNSDTEVSYNYFLISDNKLSKDHDWVRSNYPASTATTYDFYVNTGSVVQVASKVFYSNKKDNDLLYVYDLKTKKNKKLSHTRVQYLTYANKKLYFSNYSNSAYLSSMSTAGKSLKVLVKKQVSNLEVKGKYLYFKVGKKAYKMKY
ncbi:transglutaminase domain-containing protein [Kurthia sibirica]|nr:transglutaminase domain-containing protein [Kurthia sibirica]GEK33940.1 hypothetical protein KSI01_14730 [Kurthia sibirica]